MGMSFCFGTDRYGGNYKLGNLVKAVAGNFHTTKKLQMVSKTVPKKVKNKTENC